MCPRVNGNDGDNGAGDDNAGDGNEGDNGNDGVDDNEIFVFVEEGENDE